MQVRNRYVEELPQDEETIEVRLLLDDKEKSLSWNINCPLLQTRVEGVLLLLDWYVLERETSQDLIMGEILVDMLPMLI